MSGLFDQVVNYSPPLLTAGQVNYDGTWNASTNTPTLVSPPDALSKGDYYVVSAAGTQFSISFAVGDWIISNGTAWEKVDLTDAVSSVFGRTGAVVGDSTDYSAVGITNTAVGAANPSTGAFTSLSSSSTTTLNNTTIPASKTLVVTTDKLSALAATTSAELAGVISDETGSGSLVFANSPTLVTPALGTPSALVGTNITGTAAAFNINGTVGATTPSTVAATSVTALSNSGYQAVVGQLTSGDRVGISGQSSGSGTALVFFDNAQTTFRPAIFDASSHSLKISGVEKASVTSTGLQGAIGATTASTGAFTTVTTSSTIAATGAVTGSNLSGTNTGDQTITLTGGVTGSGTGSFAATVVTNANLTGVITSSGNATSIASQTGTGTKFVVDTSPVLITPNLGTPSAVVLTNASGTASININGTVGATTPSTGKFTTLQSSSTIVSKISSGVLTYKDSVSPSVGLAEFYRINDGATLSGLIGTRDQVFGGTISDFAIDARSGNLVLGCGGSIVGTFTSTGLNSTAIGATTPSTGAFTTLSATGTITSTVGNNGLVLLNQTNATTGYLYGTFLNTSGAFAWGVENSAGGGLITGSTGYDAVVRGKTGIAFSGNDGSSMQMRLSSTGLAVTGALSATGRVATFVGADVSIANSRNDNLSIGTAGFFRVVSGGASAQISGMVAGTDGQRVVIMNGTGNNVAFLFEDANSTAANRIYTESGGNITLGNLGSREFIYSTTYSRWVLVGKI